MELTKLKELVSSKVQTLGYELVSLSLAKKEGVLTLSIVVDRDEEITMNDIVDLTNELNPYLDEINPIEDNYSLDVSSLGIEKPIKIEKLDKYLDKYINVHIKNAIKGNNVFEGTLSNVNENSITISYKEKTRSINVEILKENISSVRLAIKF